MLGVLRNGKGGLMKSEVATYCDSEEGSKILWASGYFDGGHLIFAAHKFRVQLLIVTFQAYQIGSCYLSSLSSRQLNHSWYRLNAIQMRVKHNFPSNFCPSTAHDLVRAQGGCSFLLSGPLGDIREVANYGTTFAVAKHSRPKS